MLVLVLSHDRKAWHNVPVQLAAGHPIALPNNTTPKGPLDDDGEMSFAEKCAKLNRLFPPRGGISLLDPVHTNGGLPSIEKIIVEEYILDVLHFFQEDRYVPRYTYQCFTSWQSQISSCR